ncbi:hypothetical protein CH63R_10546 [Colletotrichum higginsianum IMI 349063]|uniref:Uncharacterized protein n=2 Tax=Colletotrichum higginsianum TaxID=80884 RepID=A0A1B7Y338_COLHI|nr:uncharacterized protein CH63R_10546 [Colletotrichum higginsianum IMI 349063]OBR06426.1 hypothetical protein CH63R_10546 [Colletotrichum higginsianum IMI 349063]TIC96985.1 hypothetical protein CH35J_007359 [Colletotrichum higginsianum]
MEGFQQLHSTLAQHYEDHHGPPVPAKTPLDVDVAPTAYEDMRFYCSPSLKNEPTITTEPASPSALSESDMMGFTKIEPPSPEQGGTQSRGPRQPLPRGLVANRFQNHPPSHRLQHHQSAASIPTSHGSVEGDLIDLGADPDVSSLPRETSSHDPINGAGPGVEPNWDLLLRREINALHHRLKSTMARAEIAEEKAERAQRRIGEIKSSMSSTATGASTDEGSLALNLEEMRAENSSLKEQLRDAESHIFSLQPYRKELTPEEIGREYDDLIEGITDWVSRFMDPLLDDHNRGIEDVLIQARRKPSEALRLKRTVNMYPDLFTASTFPETDEDIIVSIIMRFLNENIFQKVLYGSVDNCVGVISSVETALQNHVEPKRDLFAIRTWTAEAYNAILSSLEFGILREKKTRELANELAGIFKIYCRKDKTEWFFRSFAEQCVEPAAQLYEKIQVSTNHFYFDINPYVMCGPHGEILTSPDFLDGLRDLDCKNILQNRKAVHVAKMDPPPTRAELDLHMFNVCALTPALYMRRIGRNDSIKEPQLVRRQQMLVAWGPQDKRAEFRQSGDRTLLYNLYCDRSDRERQEAGGWATFRWGS